MTATERIEQLQQKVNELTAKTEVLATEVKDYQLQIEGMPDMERVSDAEVVDDIFMFIEQGIVRFGYPRFQHLLDEAIDRTVKYYGPALYMKVR